MIGSMSGSGTVPVAAYNRRARALLRLGESRPGDSPPLLTMARWGLENLELTGTWASERETMMAALVGLEVRAKSNPAGAVARLVCGVDDAPVVQPRDLGPDLESAAARLLENLDLIAMEPDVLRRAAMDREV